MNTEIAALYGMDASFSNAAALCEKGIDTFAITLPITVASRNVHTPSCNHDYLHVHR